MKSTHKYNPEEHILATEARVREIVREEVNRMFAEARAKVQKKYHLKDR